MAIDKISVKILCHECKNETEKTLKYLKRRVREGKTLFFCSRKCTDTHHSKAIKGEKNPNYNGKFHGITMADLTEEERKARGRKVSATMIARGTSRGSNNPRWAGGKRPVNCVVCDKETLATPYVYRRIEAGLQKACCSDECVLSYARSRIVSKRTSIEIAIAKELSEREITYIEQYNLGNKFSLDFFLPEHNIVIECDGDYWHNLPEVVRRDKAKNAYIKACGLSLYRFWEHEINKDTEACVDMVMKEINSVKTS